MKRNSWTKALTRITKPWMDCPSLASFLGDGKKFTEERFVTFFVVVFFVVFFFVSLGGGYAQK